MGYSPDGSYIASGSGKITIRIWSADVSDNLTTDTNTVHMTIALLPGNDWLSRRPGYLYYNSSLQGDEYAAVRFENRLYPVYPLEYYRDKLKRPDLLSAAGTEQISMRPRAVKLWKLKWKWWEITPS